MPDDTTPSPLGLMIRVQGLEQENRALKDQLKEYRMREDGLLPAQAELAPVTFYDLFDIDEIQTLQDAFAQAVGVSSLITHPDGRPITKPSNFCRLCREVIRNTEKGLSNCMRSDACLGAFNPTGPTIQPCLSAGIWDAGASIKAGDRHIANWLTGQVRNERVDEGAIVAYARDIGADVDTYRQAFAEVPVMTQDRFRAVAELLYLFANQLSKLALQNLLQKRSIIELAGLLPICSSCKKVRDDRGYWNQIESYIQDHSRAMISHGLCPECAEKLYGDEEWFKKRR